MSFLKSIWNFLFDYEMVNGKEEIERSMSEKYGSNWLDKCLEALKDPEVRKAVAEELGLQKNPFGYKFSENDKIIPE